MNQRMFTGKFQRLIVLYSKPCWSSSHFVEVDSMFCLMTRKICSMLDKKISNLEMELAAARAAHESILSGSPVAENLKIPETRKKRKYLMVVGINTAFSSRKRRDSVRATWMPQGFLSINCFLYIF